MQVGAGYGGLFQGASVPDYGSIYQAHGPVRLCSLGLPPPLPSPCPQSPSRLLILTIGMQTIQLPPQLVPLGIRQRPKPRIPIDPTTAHRPTKPPQTQRMDALHGRVPLPETRDLLVAQDQSRGLGVLAAVAPLLAEALPVGAQTLDRADLRHVRGRGRGGLFLVFQHEVVAEFRPDGFAGRGVGCLAGGEDGGGVREGGDGGGGGVASVGVREGRFAFVGAVQGGGEGSFLVEGDGSELGGVAGVEVGGEGVTLGEVGGGRGGCDGEGKEGQEEYVEMHCCGWIWGSLEI